VSVHLSSDCGFADKDTEGKQKKSKLLRCCLKPPRDERLYETEVLDQTLRRIAALLQVGFGDAGAQIIAQNLKVRAFSRRFDGFLRDED
jgi:hypothetical protein